MHKYHQTPNKIRFEKILTLYEKMRLLSEDSVTFHEPLAVVITTDNINNNLYIIYAQMLHIEVHFLVKFGLIQYPYPHNG